MLPTHAVGIDLGTTYSCIAHLNEHGEPVSIPNKDGELSTPSVVLFDGGNVIVGTEALRNSIRHPDRVVVHAKRYMGDPSHRWKIGGKSYSPVDISAHILRSLLTNAREKLGQVERAVITVPAQFSDIQRQATAEAGKRAGLKHVDIINEPVAAALCFVLGTEGIWFTELATTQTLMVVDLGGGTFDLSLVKYQKNEVSVIASGGDLHLGGLDWNKAIEVAIAKQFQKEFGIDLLKDRESAQALALEAEQTKRSLSVRPRAALTAAAGGQRKTYQVEQEQFERLTKGLVDRMQQLTLGLLEERKLGWAKVDVVLTTGGSSRMPMVRTMLKRLSGRTLNTSLSPDQSIAHGATYYSGMLLTNSAFAKSILSPVAAERLAQFKQTSVNARALGILVRDVNLQKRVPHYLLPAHTQLPAEVSQTYGTVIPNQRRVVLHVVESGTAADSSYVELGNCKIEPLPPNLPVDTEIEVTMRYDEQARVHVSARVSATGQAAQTEIVRTENLVVSALSEAADDDDTEGALVKSEPSVRAVSPVVEPPSSPTFGRPVKPNLPAKPVSGTKPLTARRAPAKRSYLEESNQPIPLCNQCGEPTNSRGECPQCETRPKADADELNYFELVEDLSDVPTTPAASRAPAPSAGPALKSEDAQPASDDVFNFRLTETEPPPRSPVKPKVKSPSSVSSKGKPATPKNTASPWGPDPDNSEFWRNLGK